MKLSLILLVLFTGIFYVSGSVVSATFDIMKWSEACRAFTASAWVVCCILYVLIQAINEEQDK